MTKQKKRIKVVPKTPCRKLGWECHGFIYLITEAYRYMMMRVEAKKWEREHDRRHQPGSFWKRVASKDKKRERRVVRGTTNCQWQIEQKCRLVVLTAFGRWTDFIFWMLLIHGCRSGKYCKRILIYLFFKNCSVNLKNIFMNHNNSTIIKRNIVKQKKFILDNLDLSLGKAKLYTLACATQTSSDMHASYF